MQDIAIRQELDRLYEQNRERAERAERLLEINMALSQATSEFEILAAVARYAERDGEAMLILRYLEPGDGLHPPVLREVAGLAGGKPAADPEPYRIISNSTAAAGVRAFFIDELDGVIFVEDIAADGRLDEGTRSFMQSVGARACVLIPLRSGKRNQGVVSIRWRQPRQFSASDRFIYSALKETLAAVVASRRAYLAEQEARLESELLYQASAAMNTAGSFDDITRILSSLDGYGASFHLALFDHFDYRKATRIEIVSAAPTSRLRTGAHWPLDAWPMLRFMSRQSVVVYEGVATSRDLDLVSRELLLSSGIGALMSVGLSWNSRWMGLLSLEGDGDRQFSLRDRRLFTAIGRLLEAALERIRLRQETENARQRAERLATQSQELAALEERHRLSRELHDSVSQALYGIALGARTACKILDTDSQTALARLREPLEYILTLSEAGLAEMRAVILDLRPESLEKEGLIAALGKQVASVQARYGITVTTEFVDEPDIPDNVKDAVYRITREALHNAVKHARASEIFVRVAVDAHGLSADVVDDGVGFDLRDSFPGHLGLKSMWERARRVSGELKIQTAPDQGTRVTLLIPFSR